MNLKKLLQIVLTSIILITAIAPSIAFAQTIQERKPDINDLLYKFETPGVTDPTTTDYVASLPEDSYPGHIFSQVIFYILVLANILSFIVFVVSGVLMVASQGNDEGLGKAKNMITYALIAVVVSATALAIVTGITKINFFSP